MSGLKTWDFVTLRSFSSISVIFWQNDLKEIQGRFLMENLVNKKTSLNPKFRF